VARANAGRRSYCFHGFDVFGKLFGFKRVFQDEDDRKIF
jgi:hypothetical protein